MKNNTTIFFKIKLMNLFLVLGIIFITNQTFASNGIVSIFPVSNNYQKLVRNIQANLEEDWKVLKETKEVAIYYTEVKDNPCTGYKLKIVNHTNVQKTIFFGLAAQLTRDCKYLYKNFKDFQVRKIIVNPNEMIMGSEKNPSLLLPTTNEGVQIKDLVQNLSAQ